MASLYNQATLLVFVGVFLLTPAAAEHVSDQDKIDCYPEVGNQTLCESRGCTWEESRTKVANKNNLIHTDFKKFAHVLKIVVSELEVDRSGLFSNVILRCERHCFNAGKRIFL